MNKPIKKFISELLKKGSREDGRKLLDYRKIDIEVNPIKRACGSARVKIGETEVIVAVKMDVGAPYPDSQDRGVLICSSELFPLASPDFELGPPGDMAIELARVTDRCIRESKTIDTSKLCITEGEKVWLVFVDIYPINNDGNMFDAAALGAITALRNGKMPKYDKKTERVLYEELTKDKIPVSVCPILCTFGKLNGTIFLDPTEKERKVLDARLSVATTEKGIVCAMQKGGEGTFNKDEIIKIIKMALDKGKELRKLVK